jgi:lipoprotein-anchoring transpeptidase ErfK/SrfK
VLIDQYRNKVFVAMVLLLGCASGCLGSLLEPARAQEPIAEPPSSQYRLLQSGIRLNLELPALGEANRFLPEKKPSTYLVVKLSQRRVYVYRDKQVRASYPIAIGKAGWETPMGKYQVINKEVNPIFKSFKTGRVIRPGPDNPLGVRWIGIWSDGKSQLGFHGTNQPELIGQAVSHGCIRMHNKDVVALFEQIEIGTSVMVKP